MFLCQVVDVLKGGQADEIGGHPAIVEKTAVVAHRAVDLELVLQAGEIVVVAVPGRGVHAARAALGGDIVRQDDRRSAVDEGMTGLEVLELRPLDRPNRFSYRSAQGLL